MNYLEKRRRNRVKKELRIRKPFLMGAILDREVDRVMGIADSGKMDWAMAKKVATSDYPTIDSVTPGVVKEVAEEFGTRPYLLYWVFFQKTTKLKSSGRTKSDYREFLRECAMVTQKTLSDEEKATAINFYSNFAGLGLNRENIIRLIEEEKI